ncbi:DUF5683 domain-containing protein [Leptospira ellisii]|uniref:DUF5683 domain-containing protein n=1 Tax=Leptospira ellisii TaxID=2023197 RepID=A0A2N0BC54_9LEPT|nr:DUF5683 domain-containing protein [Leptospira ellisii]MDV6236385.1 DUF5683 domain-containing protein [Leptospira ellisii]PJZ94130.1 hypothetical protein CH379_04310 [Leptospira ellisii]PKA05440.1 hypothetical protein CH375_05180 [Leptospira ellisii]
MPSLKKPFLYLSLFFCASLSAETVLLHEGGSFRGKVVTQNQKTITIQTKEGRRVVAKREILKVIYKDIDEEEEERIRNAEIKRLEDEKLAKQRDAELKKQNDEQERLRREREDSERNKPAPTPNPPPKSEVSRLGALARSAALPGWGQWASGRKFAAVIYPTLFLAAGYAVYENNRKFLVARKEYESYGNPYSHDAILLNALGIQNPHLAPVISDPLSLYIYNEQLSPFQDKREAVDKAYKNLQTSIGVLAGIYLINLADAFIFGGKVASAVGISDGASKGLLLDYNPMANSGNTGAYSSSSFESKYTLGYKFNF